MAKEKTPLQILKERRGPVPEELRAWTKEHNRMRREILKVLKDSPKTPPQVAEIVGIPTDKVFWFLMCMRKYGCVAEDSQEGDYFKYAFVKEES